LTGIVKKVKISYLIVGHTHDDVDAIIGVCASALRPEDVLSFSVMKDIIQKTLSAKGRGKLLQFRVNIGTINYELLREVLLDEFPVRIQVSTMRHVRLTASQDKSYVNMLYTDEPSKLGLYPRGIADYSDRALLSESFKHPNDASIGIDFEDWPRGPYPCTDKGHRDEWISLVTFTDGSVHSFHVKCKPIELRINMPKFYEAVEALPMQQPYRSSTKVVKYADPLERAAEQARIMKMLDKLHATTEQKNEVIIQILFTNSFIYCYLYFLK
jgi:hypothetical protein